MNATASRRIKHSLTAVVGAALIAACADRSPIAPDRGPALQAQSSQVAAAGPELGSCSNLAAPAGSSYAFHAFAKGVPLQR